jgi:hypothetical protein
MTEFPYGASPTLMGYFAGLRVLDDPKIFGSGQNLHDSLINVETRSVRLYQRGHLIIYHYPIFYAIAHTHDGRCRCNLSDCAENQHL